jgi:alpha-ketoglutarate-dependent 2,4-dichlorophenoxyacetate dioxygenase
VTNLSIEPMDQEFGARITGIDLTGILDDATVAQIHRAIDDYSFLTFPDQSFDDDRQLAFTKRLGEPEESHTALGQEGRIVYFGTIGNIAADGSVEGNDHQRTKFLTGNNMWHSDSSFRPVPTYVSIMVPYEVPEEGGLTQFVSERAAYARLAEETRQKIDPLIAIHDYVYSRSKVAPVSPSHAASLPPVRQRLVRTNAGTGARNFFVGAHCRDIDGWEFDDSRTLIEGLQEEATGAEHIYEHSWQVGELAIWDNRTLIHRGTGYNADKYRRRMRQSRVRGKANTLVE